MAISESNLSCSPQYSVANSNTTVYSWLQTINLPQCTKVFTENGFDFVTNTKSLANNANNQILQDMGINKMGHRMEIIK